MSPPVPQDLPAAADRLYALDPADFTGTRNELAGAATRSGKDELARQIAALRKPSTAAWAVNLLLRRRRPDLQRLLALADRLRDGGTGPDGQGPREINQMAGRLVTAMVRLAGDLAAEQGHPLSPALTDQVRGTLRAAMANRSAAAAVLSGHLVAALEPAQLTGLGGGDGEDDGVIDSAVAVPLAVTSLAGHSRQRAEGQDTELAAARAAARDAARDAERRADEAAHRAEQAERDASEARDERDDLAAMVQRTRRALQEQEDRLATAGDRLTDAERSHRELSRRSGEARRRADEARHRADDAERRWRERRETSHP
jgi:hypothetical protein